MSPSTDQRENREFASEVKFLIPLALADQIRDWARPRLDVDPHSSAELKEGYEITSLYFDTAHFDVFHRRGSFGRSKYRIRRYGLGSVVFLERKLKTRGLVSKRRTPIPLVDLSWLTGNQGRGWEGDWFSRRLRARELATLCQISYRRTARFMMTNLGPIRLTLDTALRARLETGLAFTPPTDGLPILENHAILELKYRVQMPGLFKLLVEEFALNPQAISKYRLAAPALGLVKSPAAQPAASPEPPVPVGPRS
jgi:hypothetical protein